jgi:hypothetical protein
MTRKPPSRAGCGTPVPVRITSVAFDLGPFRVPCSETTGHLRSDRNGGQASLWVAGEEDGADPIRQHIRIGPVQRIRNVEWGEHGGVGKVEGPIAGDDLPHFSGATSAPNPNFLMLAQVALTTS